jgi:cell division protein FtsQ
MRWFLLVIVGFVGVGSWFYFSETRILPIKTVVIQGDYDRIDQKAVKEVLLASLRESNFLTLKTSQVREQLLQVPWVASASVSRAWPAKLIVHLMEHDVVARWNEGKLLGSDGKLFVAKSEQAYSHLPVLRGQEGQQLLIWEQYKMMNQILASSGLKINQLALSPRQAWRAQLSNGVVLVLGRTDAVNKIQRATRLYTKVIGSRGDEVDYVDLRYANAIAVRWKAEGNAL